MDFVLREPPLYGVPGATLFKKFQTELTPVFCNKLLFFLLSSKYLAYLLATGCNGSFCDREFFIDEPGIIDVIYIIAKIL